MDASSQRPPLAHRLFAVFCGVGTLRARYTISKLRDFDDYARSTSPWRHLLVILLTPLPSLITSSLPTLVHLQDPKLGVLANTGYMLHFFITLGFCSLGSVMQVRAPCGISHSGFPNVDALVIAVAASAILLGFVTFVGYVWCFPVPFIWVTAYAPYFGILVLTHILVLRSRLRKDGPIRGPLLGFVISFFMQGFQIVIYPAFSTLFEASNEFGQVALTLIFPFVKYAFRQILRKTSSHLLDAEEVAVSGVEICAAMYQSMIMQNTPSAYATATIIGLDVVQGLFAIRVFMDKESVVPLADIVGRACEIIRPRSLAVTDNDLASYGTRKQLPQLLRLPWLQRVAPVSEPAAVKPVERRASFSALWSTPVKSLTPGQQEDKLIVTYALEIVQSAESILIVEYFEVSVPIVNALFLLWSSQLQSAVYNPKIRPYSFDKTLLGPALNSLALYTALQLLSVVLMHAVMKRRFRISAMTLLAYVLEHHAWSLQGKLITWLPAIFQMPVMHYGVDFTFKFDYTVPRPP